MHLMAEIKGVTDEEQKCHFAHGHISELGKRICFYKWSELLDDTLLLIVYYSFNFLQPPQ